ncbi:hypothetical protein LOAG_03037 [Loa loa]|uniref:Uncharacterized protein n=1 Tax=Loa loa TaxID=7209 RepID=A0A1S0U5E3_LOALO|nr:hypothetical protein LOAG_03037 [Loa loa]EFO25454.1 hypothetical protein LOAG_03037 [Loa loa]
MYESLIALSSIQFSCCTDDGNESSHINNTNLFLSYVAKSIFFELIACTIKYDDKGCRRIRLDFLLVWLPVDYLEYGNRLISSSCPVNDLLSIQMRKVQVSDIK